MRLILFDIDGTLLLTGHAGKRALKSALTSDAALATAFDSIRMDGKTDPLIVREVMQACGRESECTQETVSRFLDDYVEHLRREMASCTTLVVLPGVKDLLSKLRGHHGFLLGLATGNIERGAYLKLIPAGLRDFFSFGGFGSDAEDRTELIGIAIDRGRELAAPRQVDAAYVIGDTPLDIEHGRAAGARTIAVASGSYSTEALAEYKPDLLVKSLEPVEPVLDFLEN